MPKLITEYHRENVVNLKTAWLSCAAWPFALILCGVHYLKFLGVLVAAVSSLWVPTVVAILCHVFVSNVAHWDEIRARTTFGTMRDEEETKS